MSELPVSAWRCEECRSWHPTGEEVHSIVVLEIGPDIEQGSVVERVFYARRLRVCFECRREITKEKLGFDDRPLLPRRPNPMP